MSNVLCRNIMATPIIPARWFACTLDVVYVDPTQQVPSSRVKPPHYQKAFDPGMRAHKPDRWLPWASPYKPYSVRDEKSSSSDQPTLHSTGSFQTLLDILETNYEFRKELCENLSAADVTNMANAFGLKLSHSEKRKYLNPAKVITGQFPAVQVCSFRTAPALFVQMHRENPSWAPTPTSCCSRKLTPKISTGVY